MEKNYVQILPKSQAIWSELYESSSPKLIARHKVFKLARLMSYSVF